MTGGAVHSLYFSPTGATRKLAGAASAQLGLSTGLPVESLDLTPPAARGRPLALDTLDLLLLAFPVYAGRVPPQLAGTLAALSGQNTPAILLAVYGNRHYDDALLEAADLLSAQGFRIVAASAFIGEHSYTPKVGAGRPDAADLEAAAQFAGKAAEKLADGAESATPEIPGERPYRPLNKEDRHLAPQTAPGCTVCGVCAAGCPVGAIDGADPTLVDGTLCFACFACVKSCPLGLKSFDDAVILGFAQVLEEKFARPKQPETFL